MQPGDVAARGNFCTLDAAGKISDRRAGRIPTEESAPLAVRLREVKIPGYRDLRRAGEGASLRRRLSRPGPGGDVKDTDPQADGVPPLAAEAHDAGSQQNGRRRQSVDRRRDEAARRREKGQRPHAPRLCRPGPICRATRKSTASRRPRSPSIRCTRAWPGWSAWRSSARPKRSTEQMDVLADELEQVRLLLHPLQIHRQHGRRRQLRREGEEDRRARRGHSAHHGPQAQRC